jgi:hypothetical protein
MRDRPGTVRDTDAMHRAVFTVTFAVLLTAAITLTGCASEVSGPPPDSASVAAAGAASTGGKSIAPPTAAPVAISTAPAGVTAELGLPAITGGTDLTKKPVLSAGTGEPSGLVVRDLVAGTGPAVSPTATVKLKYVGALFTNGTQFDSSWGRTGADGPDTASFSLGGVIPGFGQGLVGMKVGGRREIVIPPALGYGANGTGSIPANSTLVFVVDMVATNG